MTVYMAHRARVNVSTASVVIVDDHAIVRQGLRGLIDAQPCMAVVGEAATGKGALRCMGHTTADVLILDLDLPDITGFEVLRVVSRSHPHVRVLVFSSHPAELFADAVLRTGAFSYICKSFGAAAILEALHLIIADLEWGGSRFGPPH